MKTLPLLIARNGMLVAHGAWLAALALAAPAVVAASAAAPELAYAGLGAAALPGIVGLMLAGRPNRDIGRFAISIVWTALAASVAAMCGGVTGIAAAGFLLPAAAAASSGSRGFIIEASALGGLAAITIGAIQFLGFLPPAPGAALVFAPGFPAVSIFLALGFGCGAIRLMAAHDVHRADSERHRLRSQAFDASPAPLAACESDGRIAAVSAGLRRLSPGLPRDLAGLPISDLGYEDDDRSRLTATTRPGRPELSVAAAVLAVRGTGGKRMDVTLRTADFPGGMVAAMEPRSGDGAASEAILRERDAALSSAQAKTEFLAAMSHEIRTPLNAIVGFSDVMKSRLFGPLPAKYAEYAELIHESGRHLMELIGDVLDISRIEADRYELHRERFNASDVVDVCAKLLSQRAQEAGLTLETDVSDALMVVADRKALRQMLLNLLSNAVKFTPAGGAIVVMAHAEAGALRIAVGDSGVGIPADELRRLGEPYRQASSARESSERGSGLGLSLVRSLAELHDGTMTIESTPGEGTTVTLRLPVLAAPDLAAEPEPLDVHNRIRRAQQAGKTLVSAAQAG